MKKQSVGIATFEEMKARTLAIARGELKPKAEEPKVWITTDKIKTMLMVPNTFLIRHEAQPMHAQHAEVRTAKITLVFKIKDLRMFGCRAPLARTAQAELHDESGIHLST